MQLGVLQSVLLAALHFVLRTRRPQHQRPAFPVSELQRAKETAKEAMREKAKLN